MSNDQNIPQNLSDDTMLTDEQLAKIFRVNKGFFKKLRVTGGGPIFYKFGSAVRYRWEHARTWMDRQQRNSTSDPGPEDR